MCVIYPPQFVVTDFWFAKDVICVDVLKGCQGVPLPSRQHHDLRHSDQLQLGLHNVKLWARSSSWKGCQVIVIEGVPGNHHHRKGAMEGCSTTREGVEHNIHMH